LSGLSELSGDSVEVLGDGHCASSASSTLFFEAPSTSGACTRSLALLAELLRAVAFVRVVVINELVSVLLVRMRVEEAREREIRKLKYNFRRNVHT
jgi:hypothetical protein